MVQVWRLWRDYAERKQQGPPVKSHANRRRRQRGSGREDFGAALSSLSVAVWPLEGASRWRLLVLLLGLQLLQQLWRLSQVEVLALRTTFTIPGHKMPTLTAISPSS